MAQKDARTIQAELAKPFAPEDLEWRLQRTFESNGGMAGIAVPFVTNRAIMNRLDAVVGPENWYNEYKPWHRFTTKVKSDYDPKKTVEKEVISQLCGIAIYFEERKEWIMKWDGAENSDIEPAKGGLSDSMKRAAVQWGIGRVLYNMDTVFVDVEQRGKSWVIARKEQTKLNKAYMDMLKKLKLEPAPAGGIQTTLTVSGPEDAPQKPQGTGTPAIPNGNAAPAARQRQATEKKPEAKPEPEHEPETKPEPEPAYDYMVTAMKLQKGMSTTHTRVKIKNAEGKEIAAFAQGEHPMLKPGTLLSEVKLVTRTQDTVVYYVLESYKLAEQPSQAA